MNALAFDPHRFVKWLTAVGMPPEQAEVLAEEQARLIDERLATKKDLAEIEAALKGNLVQLEMHLKHEIAIIKRDMAEVEIRMNARMAETKANLIKWMFGATALQVELIVGLIKLL